MKLILISTPYFFVEEHNIIDVLFEEGLDVLHLRKPDSEPVYCERLLTLINEKWHNKIVVHDHFYLKSEYNLMGIHLNKRNSKKPLNYSGHVSRSCHSIEEVYKDKNACNYVFLSPIYDSISKQGYNAAFSKTTLFDAKEKGIIDKKVIALGGIDDTNISEVKNFGFGGAAVFGALWSKFDKQTSSDYKNLIAYFKNLRQMTE